MNRNFILADKICIQLYNAALTHFSKKPPLRGRKGGDFLKALLSASRYSLIYSRLHLICGYFAVLINSKLSLIYIIPDITVKIADIHRTDWFIIYIT